MNQKYYIRFYKDYPGGTTLHDQMPIWAYRPQDAKAKFEREHPGLVFQHVMFKDMETGKFAIIEIPS